MDAENQNTGGSNSGDTYITYDVDLENVELLLQQNQATLEQINQTVKEIDSDLIGSVGVISALIGFLIGFEIIKELLKVWLE